MFRSFEKKLTSIDLQQVDDKISLHSKYIKSATNLTFCNLTINVPDFLKKHAYSNEISSNMFHFALMNKYNHLILEQNAIPLIKLNPSPDEITSDSNFTVDEDFIIATDSNYRAPRIQYDDAILALPYTGLHLANLSVFEKTYKLNPEAFNNSILNFKSALDFMLFPTPMVNNSHILELVWSGYIKRIVASKSNAVNDLTPHIPDGLRARIYSNHWGLDSNLKDFLSITHLSSHFAYKQLHGGLCLYFIVDKANIRRICSKFNEDFKLPLINIGLLDQGNLGDKVTIDLF